MKDDIRDNRGRRTFIAVEREGAPPPQADHLAQPAQAEAAEPPGVVPGIPQSFQPAPPLGSEEIDNLRAALAPESAPPPTGDVEIEEVVAPAPERQSRSIVRRDSTVTVQEPEAERSRAPSVDGAESRQGRSDRPDTSDEPPAQRPRLDMLAGSGGPDRLDGHRPGPSSSTRWDPSPRGGWISRPDSTLATFTKDTKDQGGALSSASTSVGGDREDDLDDMTCWENSVDDLIWDNTGMPAAIGPEEVIELFGTPEGSVLQDNVSAHVVSKKG
jgi:hypothetical protein